MLMTLHSDYWLYAVLMTDSVIPSELFDVKIPSVLTGFMRTVLDNQGMSLTNIMNQVYDDNDAFIRTVLYEFVKGNACIHFSISLVIKLIMNV